jgi:hypothetical protein
VLSGPSDLVTALKEATSASAASSATATTATGATATSPGTEAANGPAPAATGRCRAQALSDAGQPQGVATTYQATLVYQGVPAEVFVVHVASGSRAVVLRTSNCQLLIQFDY